MTRSRRGQRIVTFHGVGDPPRPLERGEERVWLTLDRFRDALDVVAEREDVEITFDDGNASDVTIALPELRARGLRATFFLVAGRIGRPGFVSWNDVSTLVREGMPIGSHGMTHVAWRGLDRPALEEELTGSRTALEDFIGSPVDEAALPFGSYDRDVLRAARAAGYRRVVSSDGGAARPGAWLQPRTTLGAAHDADTVRRVLERESVAQRWVGRAKRAAKQRR